MWAFLDRVLNEHYRRELFSLRLVLDVSRLRSNVGKQVLQIVVELNARTARVEKRPRESHTKCPVGRVCLARTIDVGKYIKYNIIIIMVTLMVQPRAIRGLGNAVFWGQGRYRFRRYARARACVCFFIIITHARLARLRDTHTRVPDLYLYRVPVNVFTLGNTQYYLFAYLSYNASRDDRVR